jgi:hypothetical protein
VAAFLVLEKKASKNGLLFVISQSGIFHLWAGADTVSSLITSVLIPEAHLSSEGSQMFSKNMFLSSYAS